MDGWLLRDLSVRVLLFSLNIWLPFQRTSASTEKCEIVDVKPPHTTTICAMKHPRSVLTRRILHRDIDEKIEGINHWEEVHDHCKLSFLSCLG